jgi:hypothetical protein
LPRADDKLLLRQAAVAHELLGDWYMRPDFQESWKPVPLELFPDNRMRAIAELANAGVQPNGLLPALTRNGFVEAWPRPHEADAWLLEVPARRRPLDVQLRELADLHHKRKLRDDLARMANEVDGLDHEQVLKRVAASKPAEELRPFAATPIEDLFAPLGAVPWLCEGLALQPGAPTMLSGQSALGKSWMSTDLGLAVASGQDFCGFRVRRGRAHLYHLEGSLRDLRQRVQCLSRARHLGPDELRGQFVAVEYPRFIFTDATLEERLMRELDGATLAVIDTFAVAATGMKENDASIRGPLDMLARVSIRTGCTFLVIHHHRKEPNDPSQKTGEDQMVRGSGALLNAISVGWAVSKVPARGDQTDVYFRSKLTMTKSWYGQRAPLEVTGFLTPGMDQSVEITARPYEDAPAEDDERDFSELDNAIIDIVVAHPLDLSMNALFAFLQNARVHARRSLVFERVEMLRVQRRLIVESGPRRARIIRPPVTEVRPVGVTG